LSGQLGAQVPQSSSQLEQVSPELQIPSPQYAGGRMAADEAARKRTVAGARRRSLIFKGEMKELIVAPCRENCGWRALRLPKKNGQQRMTGGVISV
jgi:hypothetical protein